MAVEQRHHCYVAQLESVVRQMLTPLKGVPFNLVIEAMTGYKVIDFNACSSQHQKILGFLVEAGQRSVKAINEAGGIASDRPNEVGNRIELHVKNALNANPVIHAQTPVTVSGKRKSSGYPDIEARIDGQTIYLECKTFNHKNANTTQRSFYFSPSNECKVTCDALHFLLAFEMQAEGKRYKANGFKLLSLEKLSLDVKYEFNSDNRRVYSGRDGTRLLHHETNMLK